MLNSPFLLPDNDSSLFPGGTFNSSSVETESSWSSFRVAIFQSRLGQTFMATLVDLPLKTSSVALFLNERITASLYHGYHAIARLFLSWLRAQQNKVFCGARPPVIDWDAVTDGVTDGDVGNRWGRR